MAETFNFDDYSKLETGGLEHDSIDKTIEKLSKQCFDELNIKIIFVRKVAERCRVLAEENGMRYSDFRPNLDLYETLRQPIDHFMSGEKLFFMTQKEGASFYAVYAYLSKKESGLYLGVSFRRNWQNGQIDSYDQKKKEWKRIRHALTPMQAKAIQQLSARSSFLKAILVQKNGDALTDEEWFELEKEYAPLLKAAEKNPFCVSFVCEDGKYYAVPGAPSLTGIAVGYEKETDSFLLCQYINNSLSFLGDDHIYQVHFLNRISETKKADMVSAIFELHYDPARAPQLPIPTFIIPTSETGILRTTSESLPDMDGIIKDPSIKYNPSDETEKENIALFFSSIKRCMEGKYNG